MRRSACFQAILLAFVALRCAPEIKELATGVTQSLTSGAGEATMVVQNEWGSGYCADVIIANKGTADITSWSVVLGTPLATISSMWNASRSGTTVASLAYNGRIAPGARTAFGFCADVSGTGSHVPTVQSLTVVGGGSPSGGGGAGSNGSSGVGGAMGRGGATGVGGAIGVAGRGGATGVGGAMGVAGRGGAGGNANAGTGGAATGLGGSNGSVGSPGSCTGYATRFWDCCKPHCGWSANVPSGMKPVAACSAANASYGSNYSVASACSGGGDAHTCYGLAPWAVNSQLSYGYAATSSGDVCGRCYQIDFNGQSHNAGNDPGSKALAGKTMIVQALNIGGDVNGGQFDLLVPGGGVGAFNACSAQWGVTNAELGVQYGGFLAACKQGPLGYNASLSAYKDCVAQKCASVFESRGLNDLAAGCRWFVDWFQAADNPSLRYKEVACPTELVTKSGMDRRPVNDRNTSCGN